MLRSIFVFLLVVMFQLPSNAAITAQVGSNYTGFNFSVDQTGTQGWYASDCNVMLLDINGSVGGSGKFAVYGALNCITSNTSYGVTGSGYLTTLGTIALVLDVSGTSWQCNLNTSTLFGSCRLTNSNVSRGTTTITFKP